MQLALLILLACRIHTTPPNATQALDVQEEDDTSSFDTGPEDTGDLHTGRVDTGVLTSARVTLVFSYVGYNTGPDVCVAAWLTTLWVQVDDGASVQVHEVPCANTLTMDFAAEGPVTFLVSGTELQPPYENNPYTQSEPVPVELVLGVHQQIPVVLVCHENGVDDGCGGA